MTLMLRLAVTLAILAGPVEPAAAKPCHNSHKALTMAMREEMIGKVRLNGEIITNVVLKKLCTQGFVTRSGVTWIDWTPIDNIYSYRLHDTMLLRIPRNGKFDEIAYEGDPHVAIHIRMATGLMQADCYDHGRFC